MKPEGLPDEKAAEEEPKPIPQPEVADTSVSVGSQIFDGLMRLAVATFCLLFNLLSSAVSGLLPKALEAPKHLLKGGFEHR